MDIPTQTELLGKIDAFCVRHDIAETRFGRDAVNNPAFIRGLRDGKSPTLDTLNKVRDFMARVDDAAQLRAKLSAPLDPPAAIEEVETELPFRQAPVSPTGDSSATCSSTSARRSPPEANLRSPSSSDLSRETAKVSGEGGPLANRRALARFQSAGSEPLSPGQTRRGATTPGAPPLLSGGD